VIDFNRYKTIKGDVFVVVGAEFVIKGDTLGVISHIQGFKGDTCVVINPIHVISTHKNGSFLWGKLYLRQFLPYIYSLMLNT
jgi:hypothetical protein